MDKRTRPLGERALRTLLQDIQNAFDAYDHGDATFKSRCDWLNWNVVSRLAHEVNYYRDQSRGLSIRAYRVAHDGMDPDEFFDA